MQVLCLAFVFAPLHLLSVLDDFGGVRVPYLCTPPLCMNIGELLHFHLEISLWIFSIAFLLRGDVSNDLIFLQSLDPQYSLISSNYSSIDMCI